VIAEQLDACVVAVYFDLAKSSEQNGLRRELGEPHRGHASAARRSRIPRIGERRACGRDVLNDVVRRSQRAAIDGDGTGLDATGIHHAEPCAAEVVGAPHHCIGVLGDVRENVADRPAGKQRWRPNSSVIEVAKGRHKALRRIGHVFG
jgi:hypothetical protein